MVTLASGKLNKLLRRSALVCALIVVSSFASLGHPAAEQDLDVPQQHVNDFAAALDSSTVARLENVLANFKDRTGINFVVVTIKTSGATDLFDLSTSLANKWNIGSATSEDKSILLIVATDQARFYTLPSAGAARDLPNGLVGAMGRRARTEFQQGNYAAGVEKGLKFFVEILGQNSTLTYQALNQPHPNLAPSSAPKPAPAMAKAIFARNETPSNFTPAKVEGASEIPATNSTDSPAATPLKASHTSTAPAAGPNRKEVVTSTPAEASDSSSLALARFVNTPASARAVALAAERSKPIRIVRFKTRPEIDGNLDDPVWNSAAVLKDFLQVHPGDNIPASEPTEVRIGYDDKFLYVAFRAYDSSGKVRATVAGRDKIFDDDYVGIYLDTFNDQRRAYRLLFNPLGVQADAIIMEGQGIDSSVDIVMESKGIVTNDGYVVEAAIPFKSLRYDAGAGKLWGVHFQRRIKRLNDELDSWMPISRDQSGYLSQAGHLTGIENISTARTLEIIPTLTVSQRSHTVSAATPAAPDATRLVNQAPDYKPGVTIKFGIRPNVTASLAINPDFADVEADRPVITANQRFPIFFQEKRPFFLEGIEVFRTQLQAVHTRAIVEPDVAGKLTGKIGRYSFGLLLASDSAPGNFSDAEKANPKHARFIDKNATIGVLRLKRDVGRQSTIGLIATSYNFVEKHNQLGGFDGRLRLDSQTVVSFEVLGTTSRKFFYDSLLDRNVYRTGNGFGYAWSYEKSKRRLYLGMSGQGRTRDYIAGVGFTQRTNTNSESLYISYSSEPKVNAPLISWRAANSLEATFDWQGRSQGWDNYSDVQLNFAGQTYLNFAFNNGYERLFEHEFGAQRTATQRGAFFGEDSERSSNQRGIYLSAGASPSAKYSAYAFFSRKWNAFDYDFGAYPRFERVSTAALADPAAALDPGPGEATNMSVYLTYQPTQALRSSLSYTRSKLVRNDTGRVAFADQIYSLHTDYRFTPFLFVRGRLDYDWLASDVFGQLLFGWTPNPGTAVYVGYNDSFNYGFNSFTGRYQPGPHRNDRVIFVKLSYLFRQSF